ncbi:hypothetical protein C8R48DRAFT_771643 [Suillus tomentosus]|nr:hypothetical protein C8R48DRAFT_779399 [Suillus tomentosus]KAG1868880.1 hypothetical protein C8R48DRAFT_771643 [Suillus tomentosus]
MARDSQAGHWLAVFGVFKLCQRLSSAQLTFAEREAWSHMATSRLGSIFRHLSSKPPPPAKKAAVAPTTSASKPTAMKKETKPVLAVKDVRSDSSFFSAPKPKAKLPSFKKALAPVKKEPDLNVAQPSSIVPFQEALKSMGKGRRDSPVTATPPPASITPPLLELIRLIERAVYVDDPVDVSILLVFYGVHTAHSLRDLDRGDGAALHAPLFEEVIDWTDPINLEFDLEASQRGQNNTEKTTQEEREQTALGALYISSAQIPDSPGEPTTIISDDEIDVDVKTMTVGSECDNFFWREANLPQPNAASVADLVGRLSGGFDSMSAPSSAGIQSFGFDPAMLSGLCQTALIRPEFKNQKKPNTPFCDVGCFSNSCYSGTRGRSGYMVRFWYLSFDEATPRNWQGLDRMDAVVRPNVHCVEDLNAFSVNYGEPSKRAIRNILHVESNDGPVLDSDDVEVEYLVGHTHRHEEGIPLLVEKFNGRIYAHFNEANQRAQME